jgi:hypothetical protein
VFRARCSVITSFSHSVLRDAGVFVIKKEAAAAAAATRAPIFYFSSFDVNIYFHVGQGAVSVFKWIDTQVINHILRVVLINEYSKTGALS